MSGGERGRVDATRPVHEHVDAAEAFDCRVDHCRHLRRVVQIRGEDGDVAQTAQDVQVLQEDLSAAETDLPAKARSLGMVPAENPTMVSVLTGKVVKGTDQ